MSTPQTGSARLRPLSLGEILDVSIKIGIRHWKTLLKAVLVVLVPVVIVSSILTADYTASAFDFSKAFDPEQSDEQLDELNQYLGGLVISTLLQILGVLLASAACLRAIAQGYLGEESDWRESLTYALRRAGPLLWVSLLFFLAWLGGTVLFVVPGIWLYVAFGFAMPVLLVEGVRGRKALGRSYALVKGRWWRTCGVIIVGYLLAGVVSTIVQFVFLIGIVAQPGTLLVIVLSSLAGIIGGAISTPFQAAILAVTYFDLRVRKEGFDLELLARDIGAGPPTGAPPGPPPDTGVWPGDVGAGDPAWPPPGAVWPDAPSSPPPPAPPAPPA